MPEYEFHCKECQKTFLLRLAISERDRNPLPPCPHCGSTNVEQMLSGATVITSRKS